MSWSQRAYVFTAWTVPKYDEDIHRYITWQTEICPKTKKIHYQGYAEFTEKITMKRFKRSIGDMTAHVKIRKGTREGARYYTSKKRTAVPNTREEYGNWDAGGQGARTDLMKIIDHYENGGNDYDLLKQDPEVHEKHYRWIEKVKIVLKEKKNNDRLKEMVEEIIPNDHQKEWQEHIDNQTDRTVTWVCDPEGGKGKSTMTDILISQGWQFFENAKCKDVACALNEDASGYVFDFSRSIEGRVNYGIIESIKNGRVFSSKYLSCCKFFPKPRVIVFANFYPDKTKLSEDRWDIIDYSKNYLAEDMDD